MDRFTVTLASGSHMPCLALGTWAPNETHESMSAAVKAAVQAGFRHLDCAAFYENEHAIGKSLWSLFNENIVKRNDLFITSKLWSTCHSPEMARASLMQTLDDLRLDYLDLYLIHYPMGFKEGGDLVPVDDNDKVMDSGVDYMDTWKVLEQCVEDGLVKNIGVSNFNPQQLKRVLDNARIKPVCNQIEIHPQLINSEWVEFCKGSAVVPVAYSPFGGVLRAMAPVLRDPGLIQIAARKKKSPAQIILRWLLQRDCGVVSKSSNSARIQENFDVFDFALTDEEIAEVEALNRDCRYDTFLQCVDHKYYPF